MRKRLAVGAIFLTTACLGFAGCQVEVDTDGDDWQPDPISISDLEPCDDQQLPKGLLCGSMYVPFERGDPDLGLTEIGFAVLPADQGSGAKRKGILAIEGGPGYGSIGSAGMYRKLFGDVLDDRDLIVIDARGTGRSDAIDCPDLQRGAVPDSIALASCGEQLGERFGSYRTSAIVDDFDSVLEAMGYGKVQLYGDSYGTFAAQSLAFRHPERIERIALDSAYPVRGESAWYPSIWQTGIRSLGVVCDRSDTCAGNADRRLDRFVAKLREDGYSPGPFLDLLASAGYSPPGSYEQINEIVSADLTGDSTPYFEATKQGPSNGGSPEAYSQGMEAAVSCNDYPMLWDKGSSQPDRYRELQEEVRSYADKMAFRPFTPREIALSQTFLYLECLTAPEPDRFYEPPAEADAEAPDVPVLVVNGELDNVTSPEEGRMVADLFPDARLVLVPGAGHTYSLSDPSSIGAREIRAFLNQD